MRYFMVWVLAALVWVLAFWVYDLRKQADREAVESTERMMKVRKELEEGRRQGWGK